MHTPPSTTLYTLHRQYRTAMLTNYSIMSIGLVLSYVHILQYTCYIDTPCTPLQSTHYFSCNLSLPGYATYAQWRTSATESRSSDVRLWVRMKHCRFESILVGGVSGSFPGPAQLSVLQAGAGAGYASRKPAWTWGERCWENVTNLSMALITIITNCPASLFWHCVHDQWRI